MFCLFSSNHFTPKKTIKPRKHKEFLRLKESDKSLFKLWVNKRREVKEFLNICLVLTTLPHSKSDKLSCPVLNSQYNIHTGPPFVKYNILVDLLLSYAIEFKEYWTNLLNMRQLDPAFNVDAIWASNVCLLIQTIISNCFFAWPLMICDRPLLYSL